MSSKKNSAPYPSPSVQTSLAILRKARDFGPSPRAAVEAFLEDEARKTDLDASREGRKSYRSDMRKLVITLPSDLADAIEHYSNTNWNDGRDPSKLGALNAVSYLGERLVALYRKANGL